VGQGAVGRGGRDLEDQVAGRGLDVAAGDADRAGAVLVEREAGRGRRRGRPVVDRVDGDRHRDLGRGQGGVTGRGAAGAAGRGAGVGERELEAVAAVVVAVGAVAERLGAAGEGVVGGQHGRAVGQGAVGRGGRDLEDQVAGRGLDVAAGDADRAGAVLVEREAGRGRRRGRPVVDRVDGDRHRDLGRGQGGVTGRGAAGAAGRVAGVGDRELEAVAAVVVAVGAVAERLGAAGEGVVGGQRGRAVVQGAVGRGGRDLEDQVAGRGLDVAAGDADRAGAVLVEREAGRGRPRGGRG